jgi:hypothetical protein
MTPTRTTRRVLLALLAALALNLLLAAGASALPAPVKLQFTGQFGYHVNTTEVNNHTGPEHENICTVISKDECQPGTVNGEPGAFWGPESVAGAPNRNIYVADTQNHRIQELTSTGRFVLMFGREVNETTKGDLCTAEEIKQAHVTCTAGTESSTPGQLTNPVSVAVDLTTGDVYVAELTHPAGGGNNERVQEFTPAGGFVLEIGKDVNETKKTNLCTREEEVKAAVTCGAPAPYEGPETGSFNYETSGVGNLLAVGPNGTLYVGEESRVQEFTGAGQPGGEIAVEPGTRVDAVAVDQNENVYLYAPESGINMVREFSKEDSELPSLTVAAEEPGAQVIRIQGLAVDSQGHLAVAAAQQREGPPTGFGALYEAGTGRLLSRFQTSGFQTSGNQVEGIGFNPGGELYVAGGQSPADVQNEDVLAYTPKTIAELSTGTAGCVPGAEHETDAVFDCTLGGEVDPEGVAETEAWFQWGLSPALGEQTPKQPVVAAGSLPTVIAVRPNSAFYYQLVAEDQNIKAPEVLSGERQSASTPLVAPSILGTPSTVFVTSSSAVLAAQLNPENASTEYLFEYAPSAAALQACTGGIRQGNCPGVAATPAEQSNVYGQVGVSLEAGGLQPATSYSYRLFAENASEDKREQFARSGPIASFTTAPEPVPQAQTGPYSNLGATGATISGTVNPDGAPTTYAFELGVYEGASTQFGVAGSGNLEASSPPGEETLALTGLQPGTTYAYRISLTSGYIPGEAHTLQGSAVTFTTSGLPAVIAPPAVLAQLPVPAIAFPGGAKRVVVCRRGYKRGRHDQCVRSKAKAKQQRARGRRKKK